jgi:2-dehydropantoate 2-reductase
MRILILGAGALGGYFGGRLLAAGRDVTFLVRPRTARQLAENGLRVISKTHGDVNLAQPPTVLAEELHEPFDLILVSAKAYDLDGAMEAIAPAVGPGSLILPMLNGMAHMPMLDARFGRERVLGGTCFISAVRDADGTIRHLNNRDELHFGSRDTPDDPRMREIDETLGNANFQAKLRPVILQDMWEKWSFLATLAGLTCMMRATIGDVVAVDATLPARLYGECAAVAAAEGYAPGAAFYAKQLGLMTQPGSPFTASMLRDMEDGAPVEAEQILGDLLRRGQSHGLESPLLALAYAHVRCYEERRRREMDAQKK